MSISLDPEKTLKLVRYDYLNRTVVPGQILFAGSSLMEQFPVHEFQLGAGLSSLIYNRGIGGFTTAEMLEHMETCVYALRPARNRNGRPRTAGGKCGQGQNNLGMRAL